MHNISINEDIDMTTKASIRKVIIKHFRGNNTVPVLESFIAQNKICFQDSIYRIYSGLNGTNYEELYQYTDNLCTCMNGNAYVSAFCRNAMRSFLDQYVDTLVAIEEDKEFLLELSNLWVTFGRYTNVVANICLSYDRKLLRMNSETNHDLVPINRMSYELFKNQIVFHPFLQKRIVNATFQLIELARLDDDNVDPSVLASVVSIFLRLDLYQELFLNKLLQTTILFYQEQSTIHLNNMDVVDYLKYTHKQLDHEEGRIVRFNLTQSRNMIIRIMVDNLLTQKVNLILGREGQLFALYESKDSEALSILFRLFKLIPDDYIKALALQFGSYIVTRGSEIIKTKSIFKQIVEKTLRFKQDIDDVVSKCFEGNSFFMEAIRLSFKTILNGNSFAKHLAQFVDVHLRSKDVDHSYNTLNNIMVLFRYLQSKDVFQAFYYKHFAKRLLIGKSSSQDAEKSMISKLRLECGEGFTSKLEGMMKDMELSQTVNSSFKSNLQNKDCNADLNVHVLTMSFWPNFSNSRVILGDEFQNFQEIFNDYYSKHFRKRKLLWQPALGSCILKARFNDLEKTKELQLSLIQAAILLRFNLCQEYVIHDLISLLNLPQKDFTRQIIGLIKSKVLLLSNSDQRPSEEDEEFKYSPEETIMFNKEFSDKMFRIKIGQGPVLRDTKEEEQAIERSVTHERQFNVDAAIVRIMKKNRRLSHNELMAELFQLVEAPSTTNDFKKRIELLIEREYVQRDKDNPDIYNYVA